MATWDPDVGRALSPLERKYLRELNRAPKRGELLTESVANLKSVLQARGWSRSSISGIEKAELALKVLPYLDPTNTIFVALFLVWTHRAVGLPGHLNAALLGTEVLALAVRNVRIRRQKREKMRKLV